MKVPTTPLEIGQSVRDFQKEFGFKDSPVWVGVETRVDATVGNCFPDVEKHVSENGGSLVYGWQLWEWKNVMLEGEFHAIWKSPTGQFIDISRKQHGEKTILFFPDSVRKYEKKQLDNLRLALRNDRLIRDYIDTCRQKFRMEEKGRIGEVFFQVDQVQHDQIESRKGALQAAIEKKFGGP